MKKLFSVILALILLVGSGLPIVTGYADGSNLLANPSVETAAGSGPANWTANSWGSNTATLTYQNGGHTGSKSLYAALSGLTSGDAKWIPDAVGISANQSYTYTDYYQSSVATELDAQYTDAQGNVSYVYLTGLPASASWTPASVTFTTPATAAKVSILHIIAANGWLQTDDFSLAPVVSVTPPPNTDGNLVSNPSFETASGGNPVNWQTGNWGSNSSAFSYLSGDGHTGTHSVKIQTTSYSSGDAKWFFNPVAIQPGASYSYSDYYKSTLPTTVVAQYDNGSGGYTYQTLASPAASAGWQQTTATLTAPATAKTVTIFHLIAGVGSLQIDDVALLPGSPAPPPPPPPPTGGNLVPNPSVETADPANAKQPLNWHSGAWGTNKVSFAYLTTGHSGTRSVKTQISSYASGSAYWYFDNQPVQGGQMYDFTDYYESNVISEIDAGITMSDGSVQYVYLGDPSPSSKSWTKFETQFAMPAGAVSMTIFHNIYSVGWLTIDDYSLTPFSYQGFTRPIVSVTVDDGYASFYNNGLPILKKYGLVSTDYIITSVIDNDPAYMTSSMVKGLYASGQEIGSHTVTHPDLTTLSATKMDAELKNSQVFLQNLLGVPVTDFASPYGSYNQQVITDADKYYKSHRGVQAGYNAKNNLDANNLMVQNLLSTTTLAQVQAWLAEAKATNTWLILVYHQVDPSTASGDYNTYPADFDAQMAAIKASGMAVETVSQALQEVQSQL